MTMGESQEDIDALLAEVSALAEEAVADIGDNAEDAADGETAPPPAAPLPPPAPDAGEPEERSTAGEQAPASPPPADDRSPPEPASPRREISLGPVDEGLNRILLLEVPVIVQLAERTMALSEVLSLNTGAIIEFDKPSDGELDLMINNKCIGRGQAVKVGENFGLRVAHIGSLRERIKAMGGQ